MSDQAGPLRELKATAHLMRLDPGVFCVFNAPGSAQANPATGLPGIRLSPAPAAGGLAGRVTLTGLDGDGWLAGGEDAALVRVTGGPAQVLITVYHDADAAGEAPQLQVMRLNEPARPVSAPLPEIVAHVYAVGDVAGRLGAWVGEPGSRRWIEGFALQLPSGDVEYQAVLGRGWLSPWSEAGQFCGSRGMSLPILGLRVRLRGPAAETHQVALSGTFVDGATVGPVGDGEACEAPSLAALEAFRLLIEPKPEVPLPKRPSRKR